MDAALRTQVTFHLTAHRPKDALAPVDGRAVRPALLARYADPTALRHDFPAVLTTDGSVLRPLAALVDEALRAIAPRGPEGERIRRDALRIERELRARVAAGASGTLSTLWEDATSRLADAVLRENAARLRTAIAIEGEIVGCDADMPARVVRHAWLLAQRARIAALRSEIEKLTVQLSDILAADHARSDAGRSPDVLRSAVGEVFADAFDFKAMASILTHAGTKTSIPAARRARIRAALAALAEAPLPSDPAALVFDSCSAALAAYRTSLPKVVAFLKAAAIARLEAEGRYVEADHDPFFAEFGSHSLSASDLARFPDRLVCLRGTATQGAEFAPLMEILTAGLPIKILVQVDDLFGAPAVGDGALALGSARLGPMALGLDDAFVLQTPASALPALADRLGAAMAVRGATLVSVYSGCHAALTLPPYLAAAAALQARAFPAFCYDPTRGSDVFARLSLVGNPQPDVDWPLAPFAYEDETLQRISDTLPFTFVDLVACDTRYAQQFARITRAQWNAGLVPAARFIAEARTGTADRVPYVWLVGQDGRLERAIVEESVITAARRCRDLWRHLQAMAQPKDAAPPPTTESKAPIVAAPATAPAAEAAAAASSNEDPDQPYIETVRCTSCNECIAINSRMFAYNTEKQAYIADASAGTYRQLVEAAENCPVSIIHPGKPRSKSEPGLDDLLKRAEPFMNG